MPEYKQCSTTQPLVSCLTAKRKRTPIILLNNQGSNSLNLYFSLYTLFFYTLFSFYLSSFSFFPLLRHLFLFSYLYSFNYNYYCCNHCQHQWQCLRYRPACYRHYKLVCSKAFYYKSADSVSKEIPEKDFSIKLFLFLNISININTIRFHTDS